MGEVWTCRDRELRREVAVKFLALDDAVPPDLQQRFEREAVAAAQINHPNVVALHDRGVDRDYLFLVMERVDGTTLAAHVRDSGPLPPGRALDATYTTAATGPSGRRTFGWNHVKMVTLEEIRSKTLQREPGLHIRFGPDAQYNGRFQPCGWNQPPYPAVARTAASRCVSSAR